MEDDKKFRRNYKACLNCRTRKVRCDLGPVEAPHDPPCARCKRERKECVFADSRRGGSHVHKKVKRDGSVPFHASNALPMPIAGRGTSSPEQHSLQHHDVLSQQQHHQQQHQQPYGLTSSQIPGGFQGSMVFPPVLQPPVIQQPQPNEPLPPLKRLSERVNSNSTQASDESHTPQRSELNTMQGALVFLARAAGTIARADDRDHINGRDKHEQFETEQRPTSATASGSVRADDIAPLIRPKGNTPPSMPPVEKISNVRPNPAKSLNTIEYIGPGKMLTVAEAEQLIHLFFLTMHPFFPHIPEQLQSPEVLAGYPILLCAILTISARYHPFEDDDGNKVNKNSRNIQLHERLWIYCQRLISQTIWAEASTRSVGTVLAFLLFTEWNPRAIHWRWSDYANAPSLSKEGTPEYPGSDFDATEGLTGLSAMRRSDRMAWMLVGTSVRLAQDMGFIDGSTKIFVATHIAETNTAMNLGQRSMLAQSLSEIDLDNEDEGEAVDNRKQYLHDEFILTVDEETMRQRSLQKKNLKFTFMQKAKLELLKIMSLAYETVYCGVHSQSSTSNLQNLTVLTVLSPLIEHWFKTYKKLLKPSNPKNFNQHCNLSLAENPKHVQELTKQIDKESLICDYYYCQLYIYSLALSMDTPLNSSSQDAKRSLTNVHLDEISKAAKYIELAYNAAKEILNAAVRIHKLKMLKYMPVRWVTRVVRSVAFIVKCYLTLTNTNKQNNESNSQQVSTLLTLGIVPTEDILQTIQRAAIVLREASPDELHLCTRYSTILMYLCSEMKYRSKLMANPPNVTPLDASSDEETALQESNQNDTQVPVGPLPFDKPTQIPLSAQDDALPSDSSSTFYMGYHQMKDVASDQQALPDAVVDWFMKNDEAIGLDFVEPWTEMIEQHLDKQKT